jgi:dipeptidyl aminopeptidase/acylaminoacyl peptidase
MLNPMPGNFVLRWMGPRPDMIDFARKLSPVTYVRKDVPPILAIHGDADDVVPYQQSVQLVAALKQAGAKAELITVRHGEHGFSDRESAKLWPQVFKWMKKVKLTP